MLIVHEGNIYPKFQAEGNASQFAIAFAKHFCIGEGYDIGYSNIEWKLPWASGIDIKDQGEYNAMHLPEIKVDFIYSSHCLEHLNSWIEAIEYWTKCLKNKGTLFLYLPHYSQSYWRPWNNRKHKHIMNPDYIKDLLNKLNYTTIFISGVDLNNSFMVVGIK